MSLCQVLCHQDATEREKQTTTKKKPCSHHNVFLGVQGHLGASTLWNDGHNNSHYFASSAWLWALPTFRGQTGGNNECCQAGYPFWHDGKKWYYHSFNFLSIWNLLCVHIRRLFVFIIGAPPPERESKEKAFLPPSGPVHITPVLFCIYRKWQLQNLIFFFSPPAKCACWSWKTTCFQGPANALCTEWSLNVIRSKGTLRDFTQRQIMWKPDLLHIILVHELQSFLGSFHLYVNTLSSLSYRRFRWSGGCMNLKREEKKGPCFSKNKTNPSKYLIKVTICWAAGHANPPKPSTNQPKKEKMIFSAHIKSFSKSVSWLQHNSPQREKNTQSITAFSLQFVLPIIMIQLCPAVASEF